MIREGVLSISDEVGIWLYIIIIKKYVDDLLVLSPDSIPQILSFFNSYHPCLYFTVEKEYHNSLPFLDVFNIRNTNGSLYTDWYTKPTYTGSLLNFFSQHSTIKKKYYLKPNPQIPLSMDINHIKKILPIVSLTLFINW